MTRPIMRFSVFLGALTLAATTLVVQTARAQGGGGAPAALPAAQPGHGSGQLIIWGDTALFDGRLNPENCILLSRFHRGMRLGFRMTAFDGGTGETENTSVFTIHLTFTSKTKGKQTVDIPMRWRGAGGPNAPVSPGYLRAPLELWTGFWIVPADAETGMLSYTVTATDHFNRKASFRPFSDIGAQLYVVD